MSPPPIESPEILRVVSQSDSNKVEVADGVEVADSIRLLMRNYFSTNFIWTALHTTRLVEELEAAPGAQPRFDMAHRSLAASAVVASGMFLEAAVSELFQDAYDRHGLSGDGYLAPLDAGAVEKMATVWRYTNSGWGLKPLDKWQALQDCCGREPLDLGVAPAQDAMLVVRLRNALVHFKPEDIAADEQHELERGLRGKFPENRLMEGSGNPWWPSHGLGHGCCEWAIRSSRALADHVFDDIGIRPNYRRVEEMGWNGRAP
jgi:hypothetical protein